MQDLTYSNDLTSMIADGYRFPHGEFPQVTSSSAVFYICACEEASWLLDHIARRLQSGDVQTAWSGFRNAFNVKSMGMNADRIELAWTFRWLRPRRCVAEVRIPNTVRPVFMEILHDVQFTISDFLRVFELRVTLDSQGWFIQIPEEIKNSCSKSSY